MVTLFGSGRSSIDIAFGIKSFLFGRSNCQEFDVVFTFSLLLLLLLSLMELL